MIDAKIHNMGYTYLKNMYISVYQLITPPIVVFYDALVNIAFPKGKTGLSRHCRRQWRDFLWIFIKPYSSFLPIFPRDIIKKTET